MAVRDAPPAIRLARVDPFASEDLYFAYALVQVAVVLCC